MSDAIGVRNFRLAPMCTLIRTLTLLLLALPLVLIIASLFGATLLALPALLLIAAYAWIWLRFRPTGFIVHRDGIQVRWPLKRREIPRESISNVRVIIDGQQLRQEIGWGVRVVQADFGVGSAGFGQGAGESCRCMSRAPMVTCGSSVPANGRG